MFIAQEGCCATCKTHQSELPKSLHVDHNHTTGEVRGLLCNACNLTIGKAKDSPELLIAMAAYLTKKPPKLLLET